MFEDRFIWWLPMGIVALVGVFSVGLIKPRPTQPNSNQPHPSRSTIIPLPYLT